MLIVKNNLIILIVIILSLLGLYQNLDFANVPSFIVSSLGIMAVIIYFINKNIAYHFIKIWIYLQIPLIVNEHSFILENGTHVEQIRNIWNTSQFLKFTFGFSINTYT